MAASEAINRRNLPRRQSRSRLPQLRNAGAWGLADGRGGVHRTRARPGSSGIDNTLFYLDNPAMRFGHAERMSEKIVRPI